MKLFLRLPNQRVGVELGTDSIRAAQISFRRGQAQLMAVSSAPLPPEKLSVDTLAAALSQCFEELKHPRAAVVATVPAEQLIYHILTVPVMNDSELAMAMFYEAQDMLNQGVEDYIIRHCVLAAYPQQQQLRVLLVAVPRRLVLLIYQAFRAAKLQLKMIDVPYFGLWRFAQHQLERFNGALIHIDGAVTLLLMVKDREIHHLRLLPLGRQQIDRQGLDNYIEQLDNTLEIFQQLMPVPGVMLSGGDEVPHLKAKLKAALGVPVDTVQWPLPLPHELPAQYILATGLALQGISSDEISS